MTLFAMNEFILSKWRQKNAGLIYQRNRARNSFLDHSEIVLLKVIEMISPKSTSKNFSNIRHAILLVCHRFLHEIYEGEMLQVVQSAGWKSCLGWGNALEKGVVECY